MITFLESVSLRISRPMPCVRLIFVYMFLIPVRFSLRPIMAAHLEK